MSTGQEGEIGAGQVITLIVAIYGAVLSTVIAICHWRGRRPRLRVSANVYYNDMDQDPEEPSGIVLSVTNVGQVEVASKSLYVLTATKRSFWRLGRRFLREAFDLYELMLAAPKTGRLVPGEEQRSSLSFQSLRARMEKDHIPADRTVFAVRDSCGHWHYSKPLSRLLGERLRVNAHP